MTYKAGDIIVYTNEDATTIELVAQPIEDGCMGCVGQHGSGCDCTSRICDKLPMCPGIVWKEVV